MWLLGIELGPFGRADGEPFSKGHVVSYRLAAHAFFLSPF